MYFKIYYLDLNGRSQIEDIDDKLKEGEEKVNFLFNSFFAFQLFLCYFYSQLQLSYSLAMCACVFFLFNFGET